MRTTLALLLATAAASPLLAGKCEDLGKTPLPNATFTAEAVTSGSFTPPGAQKPMGGKLPPFCRVSGSLRPTADSDIKFEVWMPLEGWNGKFQGIGNGGFAGSIGWGGLASALGKGYATASTDTGHSGGGAEATWALGHPEKIVDFGHRAIHETAVAAKAVIRGFYGEGPKRSYFNSCSNGGRQALMEAQRYPEDYDGIIAGAPANYWTRLVTLHAAGVKAMLAAPEAYFGANKLPAIQSAIRAACDARDGVTDGVLEVPSQCRADLAALECKGPETDACLTRPQLDAVRFIYAGLRDGKGKKTLFPGVSAGGEAEPGGWDAWVTGKEREKSAWFAFSTQFYKNMVYSDPAWDYRSFQVDRDLKAAERKMAPILNATNPDLRRFHARGGKLILYHGWSDAAIPAVNTIDYFRSVQEKMGAARAGEFTRLFMAPGVQHCAGGSGPNSFGQGGPGSTDASRDLNAAIEQWVEKNIAPEQVIATRYKSGMNPASGVERTRPLCAYPLVAKWKGSGSTDDAANFACAAP